MSADREAFEKWAQKALGNAFPSYVDHAWAGWCAALENTTLPPVVHETESDSTAVQRPAGEERDAFECWCASEGYGPAQLRRVGGENYGGTLGAYLDAEVLALWVGWRAKGEAVQRPVGEDRDPADFKALKKRADKARDFPTHTDACSRHAYIMAENMVKKRGYPMLVEEPWHCAISIMATVACLWEARAALAESKRAPLDFQ